MSEEGITGSSGTDENHVLQRGMLKQGTLKAIVRNRAFIILSDTANGGQNFCRLKLNPIIIENKRVEKTLRLLFQL